MVMFTTCTCIGLQHSPSLGLAFKTSPVHIRLKVVRLQVVHKRKSQKFIQYSGYSLYFSPNNFTFSLCCQMCIKVSD